jgi:hypothetical protein
MLKIRELGWCLVILLMIQSIYGASDVNLIKATLPLAVQRDVDLAIKLEGYGYHRSALHYYEKMYRTEDLGQEQLNWLNREIERLQKLLDAEKKVLPDLEVMLHSDSESKPLPEIAPRYVSKTTMENQEHLRPVEFPSNRINKKKWILTTLAIAGVGLVAYKVTKHLRRKNPPPANSIVITF